MSAHVTSWPKILALLVFGLGISVLFSSFLVRYIERIPELTPDWSAIAVSGFLLLMGCLLLTGRDWTRRILLFVVIVVGVMRIVFEAVGAVAPIHFSDISPDRAHVFSLETRLRYMSSFFLLLAYLSSPSCSYVIRR